MSPDANVGGAINPKTEPGEKKETSAEGAGEPKSESGEKKEGWKINWPTAATILGTLSFGVTIMALQQTKQEA